MNTQGLVNLRTIPTGRSVSNEQEVPMSRLATLAALVTAGVVLAVGLVSGTVTAQQATKWELTKQQKDRADKAKNPVAAAERAKSAERGKSIAMTNCAPCHGNGGKGDGPGAAALPKKPADWTSQAVQKEADGSLFVKITDGNPPMPPWGSLPDKDRWDLINYIKTLGKKA
jgi:mono/diheme cytochrome c family protein